MKEKVEKYFKLIADVIDFDITKLVGKKSHTIRLGLYGTEKNLFSIYNYIQLEKYGLALHILQETFNEVSGILKHQDDKWMFENMDKFTDFFVQYREARQLYADFLKGDYMNFLNQVNDTKMFKPEELNGETLSPEVFVNLDNAIEKNLLTTFRYRGSGAVKLPITYTLKDHIVITNSVQAFLETAKQPDHLEIVMLMRIDDPIEFSYFLMVFMYKEHVWIATDMHEFDNPRNKHTRRNPGRTREDHFENLDLPYNLIDEIAKMRAQSKAVAKVKKGDVEFLQKSIYDLHPFTRLFIYTMANHYTLNIGRETTQAGFLGQRLDQKLLTSPEVAIGQETEFEGWGEHVKKVHMELIEDVKKKDSQSTALVKVTKEMVTSHPYYDKEWLAPVGKLDMIINWTVLDKQRVEMQEKMKRLDRHDLQKVFRSFNRLLNRPENLKRLEKFIFSGDEVNFLISDGITKVDKRGWGFEDKIDAVVVNMVYKAKDQGSSENVGLWYDFDAFDKRWEQNKKEYGILRKSYSQLIKAPCMFCNKFNVSFFLKIHIRHYAQLMFLAGVNDRHELPEYLNIYRAHDQVPYHGNSILDNTHPLAMLEHPSWDRYPNGINFHACACKRCAKALYAKHKVADQTLIQEDMSIVKFDGKIKYPGTVIRSGGW